MIIVLIVCFITLVYFGIWFYVRETRVVQTSMSPATRNADTPRDRADKLAILNILNRFHLDESQADPPLAPQELTARRRINVGHVITALSALESQESIEAARQELVQLFTQWKAVLQDETKDSSELRTACIRISDRYPWLRTLLWIILLNRL